MTDALTHKRDTPKRAKKYFIRRCICSIGIGKDEAFLIALQTPPMDIFNLRSVNRLFRKVCKKKTFWERYYLKYVNKKYELLRKEEAATCRGYFFLNYSEERVLDFSSIKANDIWKFEDTKNDPSISYNYLAISNKSGILTCIPFTLPEVFDTKFDGYRIDLYTDYTMRKGKPTPMGIETQSIRHTNTSMGINKRLIITYPYHHMIIIDPEIYPTWGINEFGEKKIYTEDYRYWLSNSSYSIRSPNKIDLLPDEALKQHNIKLIIPGHYRC